MLSSKRGLGRRRAPYHGNLCQKPIASSPVGEDRGQGPSRTWTSPLGVEGSLTNPNTPGGRDGGEADPTKLHEGVKGAGGQAAARGWPGAVGGGDGTWH